ncbi:MAG: cation transporter [Nitrososphaerales archaeon]|nr:cation transporter [Nitrososphaerales archaeon]
MSGTKDRTTGVFRILSIDCAKCTRIITKSIQKLDGVTRAGVNYFTEEALVEYDPNRISSEAITKAIEKTGHKAFETRGRMV